MLLQILIKNRRGEYHCFDEEEIMQPSYPALSFEDRVEIKELYVKRRAKGLELKHQHYLEDKDYQVVLVAESRANKIIENQEESKLKIA